MLADDVGVNMMRVHAKVAAKKGPESGRIECRPRADDALRVGVEDLALLAFGPWEAHAHVLADRPLWETRCSTSRLRALWRDHEAAIRAAAGYAQPWIEQRLEFVADLTERRLR